ncbi:MAG: hypothetical protein WA960_11945, partial [Tunicatimonas sp.]
MKKIIQIVGLGLFVVGFGLWVGTFFLSDFQLTDEILYENFGAEGEEPANAASQEYNSESESQGSSANNSSYRLILAEADEMLGKTYRYNLPFINDLDDVIDRTNQRVKEVYGITGEEVSRIAEKIA